MNKILISACLSGFNVRYNGSGSCLIHPTLDLWRQQQRLVIFCPEMAAGFSTPRPPAEIAGADGQDVIQLGARVKESSGADVTEAFLLAAQLTLRMAQQNNCRIALLTDGSPSCGSETIYDGSFKGDKRSGAGVTAQLLRHYGITVYSPRQIDQLIAHVARADAAKMD